MDMALILLDIDSIRRAIKRAMYVLSRPWIEGMDLTVFEDKWEELIGAPFDPREYGCNTLDEFICRLYHCGVVRISPSPYEEITIWLNPEARETALAVTEADIRD